MRRRLWGMGYGVWSGFFRFFPVFFPIKRLKLFLRYRHQIVEIQIGKTVLNKVGKVIILRIVHKHAVNIGFHTVLQKVDGCLYPVQPVLSSRVSNLYIGQVRIVYFCVKPKFHITICVNTAYRLLQQSILCGFLVGFCFFGLFLIFAFPVPVGFGSHYLSKELFILWCQLGVLL